MGGELVRGINQFSGIIENIDDEMATLIEPEYSSSLEKFRLSTIFEIERQMNRLELQTRSQYAINVAQQPLLIPDFAIDRITGEVFRDLKVGLNVIRGGRFQLCL